ncbi:MAG: hypothetical protein IPK80_35125 [Nannocystis sp.]|nr:hypothetical protein [Nannocystis sp.]
MTPSMPAGRSARQPTMSPGDEAQRSLLPRYRTAWDALADVTPQQDEDLAMRGKWAELFMEALEILEEDVLHPGPQPRLPVLALVQVGEVQPANGAHGR